MPRFSYSLDIALRMLMLLAHDRRRCVPLPAMQERLRLPQHSSVRVLRLLAAGGLVRTRRGRGGGVFLARPPESVNLRQVMELVDGPLGLVYCHRRTSDCPILSTCTLKTRLNLLEQSINGLMEQVKLSELTGGITHEPTEFSLA